MLATKASIHREVLDANTFGQGVSFNGNAEWMKRVTKSDYMIMMIIVHLFLGDTNKSIMIQPDQKCLHQTPLYV